MSRVTIDGVDGLREAVGTRLGLTDWLTVDAERVEAFDRSITTDSAANDTGASTIPEMLLLSLCNLFLPQLLRVENTSMGVNYGSDRVRFGTPVPIGSHIRGTGEILDCTDVPGGAQVVIRIVVMAEGSDEPVCEVDTINRWLS